MTSYGPVCEVQAIFSLTGNRVAGTEAASTILRGRETRMPLLAGRKETEEKRVCDTGSWNLGTNQGRYGLDLLGFLINAGW